MRILSWMFCFLRPSFGGGGGGGDSSAELRRQEDERQREIYEGTNAVNEIFGGNIYGMSQPGVNEDTPAWAIGLMSPQWDVVGRAPGQFGDDYYSSIVQAFRDYYTPQVKRQHGDAKRAIQFNSPSLQSSAYARKAGELAQDYERSLGDVVDLSLDAEAQARTNVENSRNSIMSAIRSGSGAEEAAASATAAAQSLAAPPVYSPLGDLFGRYLTTWGNAQLAPAYGYQPTGLASPRSRSSALTTVG